MWTKMTKCREWPSEGASPHPPGCKAGTWAHSTAWCSGKVWLLELSRLLVFLHGWVWTAWCCWKKAWEPLKPRRNSLVLFPALLFKIQRASDQMHFWSLSVWIFDCLFKQNKSLQTFWGPSIKSLISPCHRLAPGCCCSELPTTPSSLFYANFPSPLSGQLHKIIRGHLLGSLPPQWWPHLHVPCV